jgi:hypothetical protein
MEGTVLCTAALIGCYIAGRRSIVWGLGALMTVGYGYGIVRANVPSPMMHFLFDLGAIGFYLALFTRGLTPEQRSRVSVLQPWLVALIGWPVLLFFVPVQDPLVQVVGLRAQIFFVPFILIGAMLEPDDWYFLAKWVAVLNLVTFGFALAEYVQGVPKYYPRNAMTQIIYASKDLAGWTAFRIPATFINAAAYCGMMVATMTLLLGAWIQRRGLKLDFWLLTAAIVASMLGVFMGASRSQAVILFLMLGLTFLRGHLSAKIVLRVAVVIVCVGWIVSNNPRLQRFTTLTDTDYATQRLGTSINQSFFDAVIKYPMGNGLGGGGTSIPYFLQDRLKNQVALENEYARILLEDGIPGLLIWIAFIGWSMLRPMPRKNNPWRVSLRLARMYLVIAFAAAMTGSGMLNSTPGTAVLLMLLGWSATARSAPAANKAAQSDRFARTSLAANMS